MHQSEEPEIKYEINPTQTVLLLLLFLVLLVIVLVFLYKKLNKDTNGEYTVRRMVYKEGGVRDRVRGAAMVLETRLGMNLWPRSDAEEDAAEMQKLQDEEGKVERGSQRSESEGEEEDEEEEGEEEDEEEECGERKGKGDNSSDDYSGSQDSDLREQAELEDQEEAGEKREEKGENMEDGESNEKGEVSGGASLLIDIKQFSGSAIWSEEKKSEDKDNDMTTL